MVVLYKKIPYCIVYSQVLIACPGYDVLLVTRGWLMHEQVHSFSNAASWGYLEMPCPVANIPTKFKKNGWKHSQQHNFRRNI